MGDLHYDDLEEDASIQQRYVSYLKVLNATQYCDAWSLARQAAVYRALPVAYIWDDHDFLGNDASGLDTSGNTKSATTDALNAYQAYVPHYPLKVPGTLYQSFDIGDLARVIITDLRTQRQNEVQPPPLVHVLPRVRPLLPGGWT